MLARTDAYNNSGKIKISISERVKAEEYFSNCFWSIFDLQFAGAKIHNKAGRLLRRNELTPQPPLFKEKRGGGIRCREKKPPLLFSKRGGWG
jgi:hypothetical protein